MTGPKQDWTTGNPSAMHRCQFQHPCVLNLNCALALAIYFFVCLILMLWHRETHSSPNFPLQLLQFIDVDHMRDNSSHKRYNKAVNNMRRKVYGVCLKWRACYGCIQYRIQSICAYHFHCPFPIFDDTEVSEMNNDNNHWNRCDMQYFSREFGQITHNHQSNTKNNIWK